MYIFLFLLSPDHITIMKVVFLLAVIVAMAAAQTYTDRWDNIDLDEILNSDRLLNRYTDCLLDKGRCSPDGRELKETLPDALENQCAKCTEKQRDGSNRVIRHFVNNRPDLWKQLAAKYDPQGIYAERYRNVANQGGINLPN